MFPARELAAAYFSQRDTITDADLNAEELDTTMDQTYASRISQDPANLPVNYSRGRRWSLDAISPKKLFSRRESTPAVEPDIKDTLLSASSLALNGDRRHSSPYVKVRGFKFKQAHRFLQHFNHHHRQEQLKESYLVLLMDNGDNIVITCEDDSHANSLLFHAMIDKNVRAYRVILISSRSIPKVDNHFLGQRSQSCETLVNMKLGDDDVDREVQYSDKSHRIVSELLDTETRFHDSLQLLLEFHADKLRLVSLLSKGDSLMLFTAIESLISLSACFIQQLITALDTWCRETTLIGSLFSSTVWNFYENHYTHFLDVSGFLNTQQAAAIKDLHNAKIKQGTLSLEHCLSLLVTRISDYGKYLSGLLAETDPSHPDYDDLSRAIVNLNTISKQREDENCDEDRKPSMDILQEGSLYESSSLNAVSKHNNNNMDTPDHNLIDNNGNDEESNRMSNKPRGLSLRRMSAPSALLFKSLSGNRSKSSTSLWSNNSMSKKDQDLISHFRITERESSRMLVMEGSVQFAMGMQIQERYLFLFSDLLLVTKQKSNTAFKLKTRVPLCDVWIASCVEEVAETTRPVDQSFVIGWPTQNVVATFPRADIKEYWLTKLREYIHMDKLKDKDKQIKLKVAPRDIESGTQNLCQVTINTFTDAKDVLLACLNQLNIPEHEAKDYQLWVLSGKEGSPYPLIGHETPFSIKLSHIRGLSRSKSGETFDNMTAADLESHVDRSSSTGYKCEFYLKQKSTKKNQFEDTAFSKPVKKNKKSPNIFNTLFRKKRPAQHLIFGLPLSEVCDENLDPPECIIKLMVLVYQQGPQTPGILRRGNKATLSKEIRDKIDSGEKYLLEDHMAPTAASVFKEFLRSIPEGLLVNELYQHWTTIKKEDSRAEKITKIKTILEKLPPAHYRMVKLTVSLLQHLAKYSSQNHMGPSNLATCIAPSFYAFEATASPQSRLKGESLKQMQMQNSVYDIQNVFVPLISFMIVNHVELFGDDILSMFTKYGCQASPHMNLQEGRQELQMQPSLDEEDQDEMAIEEEQDDEGGYSQHPNQHHMRLHHHQQEHMQQDSNSGTDSDSMHSVLSMQDTGMSLQNNDSSTDSLVDREFFTPDADSSPKAAKSHISPTNLSRDSGLTLSDTQLYDEEFHRESASIPTKIYQRSASHVTENEYNQNNFNHNFSSHFNKHNPIAPPRKRSSKVRRDSNGGSDTEQSAFIAQRSPFKYGIATLQQDSSTKSDRSGELRPLLTHPLLSKRVSSDSIGEEDELDDQFCPADLDRFRTSIDKSMVVKSESGASFLLNEKTATKYQPGTAGSKSKRFVRQSSVIDNTPPVSPQSRHSQSSHDSVISDSVYSVSQDGSVHSAPQTPDEPGNKSLVWVPDMIIPGKPWNEVFAHNLNFQHSIPHSKSTSELLNNAESTSTDLLPYAAEQVNPSSPKLWPGKFHEAEEIEMRSPHFRQNLRPNSYHSTDLTFHVAPTSSLQDNQLYKKHWFASHFDKGSPPPKVILQTLQTPLRQDSLPVRAGHDHTRVLDAESSRCSFDSHMSAVRQEEYVNATSRPIIIAPPGSTPNSVASRRARLARYMSNLDLPLLVRDKEFVTTEPKRPDRPPNYREAMERKLMIKNNVPLDAKTLHESQQICTEVKNVKHKVPNTTSLQNTDSCKTSTGSENVDNKKTSDFTTFSSKTLSPLRKHSTSSDHTDSSKLLPLSSTNNHSKSVFTMTKSQSVADPLHLSKVSGQHLHPAKSSNKQDCTGDAAEQDIQKAKATRKDPEMLYLQSVQIYEQKTSAPVSSVATPFPKTHPQQSVDSAFRSSSQKSSSLPPQKTSTQRTIENAKSRLELPQHNLYRTHSISAEHLHDIGISTKSRTDTVNHPQMLQSSSHQSFADGNNDLKTNSVHRDIKTEIQQNFMKAKSYFSQSQDDQHISSASSEYHMPSQPSEAPQVNRLTKWAPKPLKSAVSTEDMTVQSASTLAFKTRAPSKGFHPISTPLMEQTREIHWSVKDLKTKYDKSNNITNKASNESNKQPTSATSQPRSPPPYQNPPPFRSTQKSDHVTSSNKTSSETANSQKLGPQSHIYDTNGSYSSSDDSYISSLDRNSIKSGGSGNDSEALSDYTNITYV